jgi:transcription elongation factor GreA
MSSGTAQMVLTAAGVQRIEDEITRLRARRRDVAESIRNAKGLGDVSENPEFEHAKIEQAFVESRMSELKEILSSASVIEPEDVDTDQVGIGSVVRVLELPVNEDWELMLVGSYEASPEDDRISYECPLGQALLGKKPGDEVEVQTPAGTSQYRVLSISRPTE